MTKLKLFRLIFDDGTIKTIKARSIKDARIRFLGTNYHFETESFPDKIEEIKEDSGGLGLFGKGGLFG